MLNNIISKLNGQSGDMVALTELLAQLGRDREAVRAEIEELNQRRRQALLDDAPDAELDKIERELDRTTIRLEKLTISEAPLRERIAAAQAAVRKKAVARHFESIAAAYENLRDALLKADAAQIASMKAREAAIAEVGEHALADFPIFAFAGFLGRGAAESWVAENDRILAAARASRSGQPPRPAASANKTPALASRPRQRLPHGPAIDATPSVLTAGRTPDDITPLAPGECRVEVMRNGYSPMDDRPQCHRGQKVKMPAAVARRAESDGLVKIIEEGAVPCQ